MIKMIIATKAQKISQKSNTPSVPYIVIGKDGASKTAIQFFPKGGARGLLQGNKDNQFIAFGLCENAKTFGIKLVKDKKTAETLASDGTQIRCLIKDTNLSGGFGCSSLKKSIKNEKGLDFTDMTAKYSGLLKSVNSKDNGGFSFLVELEKE